MFSQKSSKSESSSEGRRPPAATSAPSLISRDLKIIGNLECDGDIQVDGRIEGDVRSRTLTIGEGAEVSGIVETDSARIRGAITGKVHARQVEVAKSGRVMGDIVHEVLSVEAGAHIEGNLRRAGAAKPTELTQKTAAPSAAKSDGEGHAAAEAEKPSATQHRADTAAKSPEKANGRDESEILDDVPNPLAGRVGTEPA
jgi:cytoskeletal protein CcmA (bactofilin family)